MTQTGGAAMRSGRVTSLKPRKPLQKRSRERFEILLNSTDALLSTKEVAEIGLYDIAQHAGVPAASVYHLFPSREAAFAALAQRYLEQLQDLNRQPLPLKANDGWQDQFSLHMCRSVKFYNDHPAFMSLVLGGALSAEVRAHDFNFNSRFAETAYDGMNRTFVMPYLPDATTRFYVLIAIFDGMCTASYGRFGTITDQYRDEMIRAIIAYFRTFLPEILERREDADEMPVVAASFGS